MIASLLCAHDSLLVVCRDHAPVGAEVVDARQPGSRLDNGQNQVRVVVVGDALQHTNHNRFASQNPTQQILLHADTVDTAAPGSCQGTSRLPEKLQTRYRRIR